MTAMSNYSFGAKASCLFLASAFVKFNMLAAKRKNKEPKCWCFYGWVCENHPNQPWAHKGCGAAADPCKNPQCAKIRRYGLRRVDPIYQSDSVFYPTIVGFNPEEESHRLEKLNC